MTVDVEQRIRIDRPRRQVAAYATDPARDPEWIGGVSQVELLTTPPLRVGSQVRRVASFLGRRFDYVLEVVEQQPDERVTMRSVRGPFPMVVTYRFADQGPATLASVRVQGDAGGFFRLAAPLVAGRVRRGVQGDLERLKRNLESGGSAAGQ